MTESENILPNSFNSLGDAVTMAGKIRRSSIIVQDIDSQWKVLITNNRYKIHEDLQNIDLSDSDGFIHINDSFGVIPRSKCQLSSEDLFYFAKLISEFNSVNSPLIEMAPQISASVKKLITLKKDENKEADALLNSLEDRSGVYEVGLREFFCYYKTFIPLSVVIEQEVDNDSYTSFFTHITINDNKALDAVSPAFRKSQRSLDDVKEHISLNRTVEIKLKLKEKILNIVRDQMFRTPVLDELMELMSPLDKGILTDISNYDIEDVKLL